MAGACACALRQDRAREDLGIPVCTNQAAKSLLTADALQCWFVGPQGRWRTLNHQSHLEALVVEVEAHDLGDAVEIARRIVADPNASPFGEILVYVARPQGGQTRIRRVRWTRAGRGFETMDFTSPVASPPLTIVSSPGGTPIEPQPQPSTAEH
jgi:hypothetical protein